MTVKCVLVLKIIMHCNSIILFSSQPPLEMVTIMTSVLHRKKLRFPQVIQLMSGKMGSEFGSATAALMLLIRCQLQVGFSNMNVPLVS